MWWVSNHGKHCVDVMRQDLQVDTQEACRWIRRRGLLSSRLLKLRASPWEMALPVEMISPENRTSLRLQLWRQA